MPNQYWWRGPSLFANSPFLACLLVLAFSAAPCVAQLRVLSRGDVDAKWRESQITSLKLQLREQKAGKLADELSAQVKWLERWQPDSLTVEPTWPRTERIKVMVEPTLDPNRLARGLRSRLLGPDAKPSVRDTKNLESLLAKHPDDIGVRQLHLHWLDQLQYRKQYADEIVVSATRFFGLLEETRASEERKLAQAFAIYRKGRALAYRELPDVVSKRPIEDEHAHELALLGAFAQLNELVGQGRPEFILLEIRMLRRDKWHGRALELLEKYGSIISPKWYLKKRRDLLRDLAWDKPAAEAATVYRIEFPDAVAKEVATSQEAE